VIKIQYIADDGSRCKNKKEMDEINKRVEKLLMRDKIARIWNGYQMFERATAFQNIIVNH